MTEELAYKNVCLVCGTLMDLQDAQLHLSQNVGHVLVECILRADDPVGIIAMNNRIPDVEAQWESQCKGVAAKVKLNGNERMPISGDFPSWTTMVRRVIFVEPFAGVPTVGLSSVFLNAIAGLEVSDTTAEYFEVSFQVKTAPGQEAYTVFGWEATYDPT